MTTGLPVSIRLMEKRDLPAAYFLSKSEGWNQTVDDWTFLLDNHDNICIVAEKAMMVAGTATALVHSGRIAWIGMVLVDQSCRGMGIGRELMNGIIGLIPSTCSIRLDATPAGKPLYEKLGFKSEYSLLRMTAPEVKAEKTDISSSVIPIDNESLTLIAEKDAAIFGTDRTSLLSYLGSNAHERAFMISESGDIKGYSLGRKGIKYNYAGPLCADSFEIASQLLSASLAELGGKPAAVDVMADKKEFIKLLEKAGFVKQREFTRMYLHEFRYPGKPEYQYLISGPEFG